MSLVRWQNGILLLILWVTASVFLAGGLCLRIGGIATGDILIPAGVVALIMAATATLLERIDRNRTQLLEKIDQSVGQVWDAGGRARERQLRLEETYGSQGLAAVHEMPKR